MGAIVFYFHVPHGATKDEVLCLRADLKEVIGILIESLSAERTSYPGDGLRANSSSRVHHPQNPKFLGAMGTSGDKLIGHEAVSFPGPPLTLEVERQQPRKVAWTDA